MVHCPKCSSPIGTDLPACPICHQAFSDADKEAMASETAAEANRIREKQQKAFEDFCRKRSIFGVSLAAAILLLPVVTFIIAKLTKSGTAVVITLVLGMLLWAGIIIGGIITGAARCPHCDAILFRQYGPHCHSCGGKLRE